MDEPHNFLWAQKLKKIQLEIKICDRINSNLIYGEGW